MKDQILVHVHIYYPDLWPTLKEAVKNIYPRNFTLYVTTIKENAFLKEDVLRAFPKAHFWIVENVGYDVGPFMYVISRVNLDQYDYIVKLHGKRDMPLGSYINYYDVSGSKWRDFALEFISTKEMFEKTMKAFNENKKLGMVSNYRLIVNEEKDDEHAAKKAKELLKKVHLKADKYGFTAGSMFMCRAKLLEPLKALKISLNCFGKADKEHHASTLAHVFERLFGLLVLAQKQTIEDVFNASGKSCFWAYMRRLKQFLFLKKENKKGQIKIKICKIPVFVYNKKKEIK